MRVHLRDQIDKNRLELHHHTEREGNPYALVCTKKEIVRERRLNEYREDIKHMSSLIEVLNDAERQHDVEDEIIRMRQAVERGKAWELA